MMIRAITRMQLPAQKYLEILRILRQFADQSRVLPGCISTHLYGDLDEKDVILVEGVWQDHENLENYLRSEEYHQMLIVAEMALKRPEIRFETIAAISGIETIEKARRNLQ